MALQISDTTPRVQYTATSGQTSFSVPFEFFAVADLKVYNGTTLLTYSTSPSSASQYSVTGAGVTGGGSITLGSPGATLNDVITIVRDLAIERLSDFPVSGNFPIQTLNSELDKIVAMLQQLEEQFARTLQYPVTTTTGFDVDLPELVANRVLSVNADATALLAEQELGTFKGDWAASTSYQVRDLVKDTSNGNIYFVNAAHTSSGSEPLSSNTNSSKYDLIIDAESATTSATNAATSATAAASSATAAATSATNAATSETNAATSESNASTSETNASTSATNASNSATAAATSATNAATSESNASTSETNAATSATNAASSATSAAGSATTATTQASAASTSASNAATSESNAATSASNASTSETNAATSATNASNAQTAAETAQAAAEAAADSIDDTYLGAKASNPTVDNDGDPLTVGDWYFNTTSNQTFIYNGSSWDAIAPDLIGDATPQLGGDLDLNSNDITGTGNINITGTATVSGDLTVDTDTLYVDSANNRVGIGETSPQKPLHIYNEDLSSGNVQLRIQTGGSGVGSGNKYAGLELYSGATEEGRLFTFNNDLFLQAPISGADMLLRANGGTIQFANKSGYGEAMRIDSSGNVGIGTSSPDGKLHIGGISGSVSGIVLETTEASGDTNSIDFHNLNGDLRMGIEFDASTADLNIVKRDRTKLVTFDESTGNVGIGTSSPQRNVHIHQPSASSSFIQLTNTVTGSASDSDGLRIGVDANSYAYIYQGENQHLAIGTNNTEAMRIDSSQNLIVGKTSVDLGVAGVEFRKDSYNAITRNGGVPLYINRLTSDGGILEFRKDNATVGSIGTDSSGNSHLEIKTSGSRYLKLQEVVNVINSDWSGNEQMTPATSGVDFGNTTFRWQDLFMAGNIYLGGTGSANALDDYEEGTWTPTVNPTTSGSVSLSDAIGSFTKVGNMVYLEAKIELSSISSPNGYIQFGGLPFSSISSPAVRRAGSIMFFNVASANVADFMIYMNNGVNVINCVLGDGTTQQLDSANQLTATTQIRLAISYRVA